VDGRALRTGRGGALLQNDLLVLARNRYCPGSSHNSRGIYASRKVKTMTIFKNAQRKLLPEERDIRMLRNRLLAKVGLARATTPLYLTEHPETRFPALLQLVVGELAAAKPCDDSGEVTVLQVGAYDGVTVDDLSKSLKRYRVRAVLVEPQPTAFDRLRELYGDNPQYTLINAAVDRENGKRTLYVPLEGHSAVASFDRQHLIKHGFKPHTIHEREVDCLTLAAAAARGGLETVDLLQIDAEGYDYEIIKSIDFDVLQPRAIRFEHVHFKERDLNDCLAMLAGHGYQFLMEQNDMIAMRPVSAQAVEAA